MRFIDPLDNAPALASRPMPNASTGDVEVAAAAMADTRATLLTVRRRVEEEEVPPAEALNRLWRDTSTSR